MNYGKIIFCKTVKRFIHIFVGVIIGFVLTSEFRSINYENFKKDILFQLCSNYQSRHSSVDNAALSANKNFQHSFEFIKNLTNQFNGKKKLLLVGVMTADKFLDSRAMTIYKSWANDLNGDIIFFSGANSRTIPNLPLVALPEVDDSYPPQKKSFLMFKFLHDYFGDKYNFFMRADDDVFVNVKRLKHFLHNLNSSEPIYIGQTGVGNKNEFGQLNLHFNENFCMGGPGVIMSYKTLSRLATNIQRCLKNLYSTHEDVEIGRCIKKYSDVSCTWSYDMQNFFYHNFSIHQLIKNNIYPSKELYNAITVHPIKDQVAMKNLYLHFKNVEHQDLRHDITKSFRLFFESINNLQISQFELMNLLNIRDHQTLNRFIDKSKQHALAISLNSQFNNSVFSSNWKFFSQKLYSELSNNPKSHLAKHITQSFNDNIQKIMSFSNRQSIRNGRILAYNNLYYGYVKFDPQVGVKYILDLLMIYRKFQGKRLTIPLRRHAYVVQTFSEIKIQENQFNEDTDKLIVNIVVPLAGRKWTFLRFIDNFIEIYQKDRFITFSVVIFPDVGNLTDILEIRQILSELKDTYNLTLNIIEINGAFSRAVALQKSSTLFPDDSLLFFLDVDMHFNENVLFRVRRNTQPNNQIYFPIVFSQYSNLRNSNDSYDTTHRLSNLFIDHNSGYWRQFGFGIVSLFKRDLISVGGYNVSINGWGMEDVNLYDRIVDSNLTIFRAIDPDLIHVYHDIHCDKRLSPMQFEMCLGTKLSSLDSIQRLSNYVNQNKLL